MKFVFAFIICCIFATVAMADTTLSRDYEGAKIQGASYSSIRSASIGTKGFKCFSTANKMAWEIKVTNGTDTTAIGFKMFFNGSETVTYPVSDKFFQFQNAPTAKTPVVTKVCLRGYSSATAKTAHGVFQ